jgi:hypothetical protein
LRLQALASELDLDPETLRETLDVALGMAHGRPRIGVADERDRARLVPPIPAAWEGVVDECLRLPGECGAKGPLPALTFDPGCFVHVVGGRSVFRPARDTVLVHLGHPMVHHALAAFARARFPGAQAQAASRWTVRRGGVPAGADALLLLTVEELAVNELRETFHHWVRTIAIPVRKGGLDAPLDHAPAAVLRATTNPPSPADVARARAIWDDVATDARKVVDGLAQHLETTLREALETERVQVAKREQQRFQSRQGELSKLIQEQTLDRLEREIAAIEGQLAQGTLFDNERRVETLSQSRAAKEEEVGKRRGHIDGLRVELDRERRRVIEHILPRRHTLRGGVQVFPVAVEIRLPEAPS